MSRKHALLTNDSPSCRADVRGPDERAALAVWQVSVSMVGQPNPAARIELELRGVRMPIHDALPAVVHLVLRARPAAPPLLLSIGADAAQFLLDTARSGSVPGLLRSRICRFAAHLHRRLVLRTASAPGIQCRAGRAVEQPQQERRHHPEIARLR